MSAADILRAAEAARIAAENAPPPLTMEQLQANRAAALAEFHPDPPPPAVVIDEVAEFSEEDAARIQAAVASARAEVAVFGTPPADSHDFAWSDAKLGNAAEEEPPTPTVGIPEAEAFAAALAREAPKPRPMSKRSKP